jgi:hypothetical protein
VRTQVARIREIMRGHSARVLVHAVDADGLEYKLEVPTDAAQGLAEGHVLVFTWSAHAIPAAVAGAQAPTTSGARSASQAPSLSTPQNAKSADEQFLELTGRRQPASSSMATGASPVESRSTAENLAELLGVRMNDESRRS